MTSESVMLTYYRCTACSECFFSEGSFIHHAKKTHCKVLVSEGHDPGDDPDGARATPGRDSEVSARDLAEREVARATSEVMPKTEEQASCRGGGGGGGYASVAPASVYQLQQDFIQPEQQRGESLEGAAYRAEEYGQAESGCQTLRHRSAAADPADEGQGHPPKVEMVDDSDEMDIMEILAPDGYSSLPPGGGDALAYSLVAPPYATTPPPPLPLHDAGAPLQQQQRPLEPRRCARCRKRFFTAFGFQRHKCNARNLARRHAARPLAVALPGGGGGDAGGGATVNALYEPRRGELVPMQGEPLRYDGPADDGGGGGGLVGGAGDTMMLAHGQPAMAADGADYWLGQQAGPSDTRRAKGREQWSVGGQGGMRAGVMTSYEEAQKHGMVELYKGYRVFVTQRQMIEILSKRKGEAAARCLLMTFYRKHELLGRNLTGRGSGTKSALDPAITKSIIAFCIDRFPECTATKIKAVLRTCITRIEWEAKHGRFNPSLQ